MTAQILSIGKDYNLMSSRTMLLTAAGYAVKEVFSVDKAIILAASDLIDLAVICHTVDKKERKFFIYTARQTRQLLPIIFIRSFAYELAPASSIAIDNDPEILLDAIRKATKLPSV